MKFRLKNSNKTLIHGGGINKSVLTGMISEAYTIPDLYAEDSIAYTRLNKSLDKEECFISYKELWDSYRNITQREDKHPYDKDYSIKEKSAFFVAQTLYNLKKKSLVVSFQEKTEIFK